MKAIILSADEYAAITQKIDRLTDAFENLSKEIRKDDRLYNIKDAAKKLGLSTPTLHKLINADEIEYIWVRGSKYFTAQNLDDYKKTKSNKSIKQ